MRFLRIAAAAALGLAFAACGARSSLPEPRALDGGAGGEPSDAGPDADRDAPADAPADAPPDVVVQTTCADASILFIYLITLQNNLFSFYPPDNAVTLIGPIACPTSSTPYSMGVNRPGFAYSVFSDGALYKINMADATCETTPFAPGQLGFNEFGMGFSTNGMGPDETLYVAEINNMVASKGLASIDLDTFTLKPIGSFSENPGFAIELTGTGDGHLYGYFLDQPGPGGHVVEIDKDDASIISSTPLPVGNQNSALAFAFWGGDFYIFTSNVSGGTDITRYRPADGSVSLVGAIQDIIVGAGVSTCAPG